jgi:putative membrane protein
MPPEPVAASDLVATSWRRVHPWSVLFNLGGMAKSFAIPLAFLAFAILFGGGDGPSPALITAAVGLVIGGVFQLVYFLTVRYRFDGNDLVVRTGLIFRSERRIPMIKVQNIDLIQNLLHRTFGVAKVKLETASGAGADASFSVLSLEAVEELRTRVLAGRGQEAAQDETDATDKGSPVPSAATEVQVLRLSTAEVVKLGLMTFRGIVLAAVVLAIAFEAGIGDWFEKSVDVDEVASGISSATGGFSRITGVLVALSLVFIGFAALAVLSILWSLLRFHGFRLTRVGEDLRVDCGLLTKVSATVPRGRIQFVSVRESPVHRLLNRVTVRVETAGGKAQENGEQPIGEKWIAPLVPTWDLPRVLDELRPGLTFDGIEWQPVARGALRRMSFKAMLLPIIVSLPLIWWHWTAAVILAVILLALGLWSARREAAYRGCAMTDDGLWFRSGAFTRQSSVAPLSKLQTVHWTQSPFDRRHGHATLHADTAGAGPAGHVIAMQYLAADEAERLSVSLYGVVGRTDFTWT